MLKKIVLLSALLSGLLTVSADPVQLQTCKQKIVLEFADPAAAEKAVLSIDPLPFGKELVISGRWDDTRWVGHKNTIKVMQKNGIKGTFYLTAPLKKEEFKILLDAGNSVGLHTDKHIFLTALDPAGQFKDFMYNRIRLESASNTPANSMVLPFCHYASPEPYSAQDLGKTLLDIGVIGAPTVFGDTLEKRIFCPSDSFAGSLLLRPGDRDVDLEKGKKQIADAFANKAFLARQPAISFAMHSIHTPDGLQKLDELMAMTAGKENIWYANISDYAAYRYEYRHAKISKTVSGSKAVFEITRFRVRDLNADVPLYLSVSVPPAKASGAELTPQGKLVLPHLPGEKLPEIIACEQTGKPLPGIRLVIENQSYGSFDVRLENNSGKKLEDITLTFRSGPLFENSRIRENIPQLDNGKSWQKTISFGKAFDHMRFAKKRAFYSAQADFVKGGVPCRIWSYSELPAAADAPLFAAEVFRIIPEKNVFITPEELSVPGRSFEEFSPWPALVPDGDSLITLPLTRYEAVRILKGRINVFAVLEFNSEDGKTLILKTHTAGIWLNGKKLQGRFNSTLENTRLEPQKGRNRLLLKISLRRYGQLFVILKNPRTGKAVSPFTR